MTSSPAIDGSLIPAPIADTIRARGSDNVPIMGGGCRHKGTLFPIALGFKPDGREFAEDEARAMFASGTGAPNYLGRVMRELWVQFAGTGTPSAAGEPPWPAYNTRERRVLLLDAERRVEDDFDAEIRQLWF